MANSFQQFIQAPNYASEARNPVVDSSASDLVAGLGRAAEQHIYKRQSKADPNEETIEQLRAETARLSLTSPEQVYAETSSRLGTKGHPGFGQQAGDPEARAAMEEAGLTAAKMSKLDAQRGKRALHDIWLKKELRRLQNKYPGYEHVISKQLGADASARELLSAAQDEQISEAEAAKSRRAALVKGIQEASGDTQDPDDFIAQNGDLLDFTRQQFIQQERLEQVQRSTSMSVAQIEQFEVNHMTEFQSKAPQIAMLDISEAVKRHSFTGGTASPQLVEELKMLKAKALVEWSVAMRSPKGKQLSASTVEGVASFYDNAIAYANNDATLKAYQDNNALALELARSDINRRVPGFNYARISSELLSQWSNWIPAGQKLELATAVAIKPVEHIIALKNKEGYSILNANIHGSNMTNDDAARYQANVIRGVQKSFGSNGQDDTIRKAVTVLLDDAGRMEDSPAKAQAFSTYFSMMADPRIIEYMEETGGTHPMSSSSKAEFERYVRSMNNKARDELQGTVSIPSGTAGIERFEGPESTGADHPVVVPLVDVVDTVVSPDGRVHFFADPDLATSYDSVVTTRVENLNRTMAPRLSEIIRGYAHTSNMDTNYTRAVDDLARLRLLQLGTHEQDAND